VLEAVNATVLDQCRDVAVHAGVVTGAAGSIAFPAVSGAGKSTLTAACVQAGSAYVSDEALVLTDAGGVRAYARPLGLSSWTRDRLGLEVSATTPDEVHLRADALGPVATTPPPVAHLVLIARGEGCHAAPLSRAETAMELLRRSFNHYRDPQRALSVIAGVVRDAQCWRLSYDDPHTAAAWVGALR
jgi:hypothetical protein